MNLEGPMSSYALIAAACFFVGVLMTLVLMRRSVRNQAQTRLRAAKESFVALASHYLLTPISIIQGALSRLQEADSSLKVEERQKLYATIEKGQQRLWILTEQFMLVNQIDEGMLRLNPEAGIISDAITAAISSVDVFAREKEVQLVFSDNTRALQQAKYDQRRFKQALIAILDNAIKFSPQSAPVTISVREENSIFIIEVNDKGPGMSQEAMALASQTFARGTSSYTFDHEGIGLGLFVAYAIIREHGGELKFESKQGQGTVVIIRFPSL